MQVEAIKTHRIELRDSLEEIFDLYIPSLEEQTIVAITSKIISICQGRVIEKSGCSKEELIKQEADAILQNAPNPYGICLTIKDNILIPSAGIDESNGSGIYILYPQEVQEVAQAIWTYLRTKHNIDHLGIIITDSHTTPMRRGVVGIALGWCGFEPLFSYVGKPDIYGQPLRVTQINLLDALATSVVLIMGEGNEQTPLAVIKNAPKISFLKRPPTLEEKESVIMSIEDDLYAPLLLTGSWVKK
ncbi:MAG: putative folate metabolism gamma-glutamate ligase [Proteobacteria bacterium]|nr:putative folate metabolism gamma-glutamate ligase [Pseudomonadota bacterium]